MSKQYSFSQELALYGGLAMFLCLGVIMLLFSGSEPMNNHMVTIIYNSMIYIPPGIFMIGIVVGISGSLRHELVKENVFGLITNITMLLLHSFLIVLFKYNWLAFN